MQPLRVGVVGAGSFGCNHLRVLSEMPDVVLCGVVDARVEVAREAAEKFGCPALSLEELCACSDAAVVATPTTTHADIGCRLLHAGVDVLIEKPIAADLVSASRLTDTATQTRGILQVGHLERFNPAVEILFAAATLPLFFEIHRMSVFTPRSLDVDVVLDLMIHDIDVLLALTGAMPDEIRAAGIRILSHKVDIANVRLAFPNGCVANLTASRVSVEKIRKLRLFQPGEYISVDYARQEVARVKVSGGDVGFDSLEVERAEPLRLELEAFVEAVRTREAPVVTGQDATKALEVCLAILDKIEEHGALVEETVSAHQRATLPGQQPS